MARRLEGIVQDYETGESIKIYSFSDPQKSRSASYDDVAVRGRSEPHDFYSSTDAQQWSLTVFLAASVDQGDNGKYTTVRKQENFIESLLMPDYGSTPIENSGVVKPPHYARIKIGRMMNVVCSIRSFSVTYPRPYGADGLPQIAEVALSFNAKRVIRPLGYAATRQLSLADRGE